jgi:hypothetical protein
VAGGAAFYAVTIYSIKNISRHVKMYLSNDRRGRVAKAKPKDVAESGRGAGEARAPVKRPVKKAPQRLPRAECQARVLAKAAEYFGEHRLNAQTRAIESGNSSD